MAGKDPITCHVLDTTAGRPASGIRVILEGPSSSSSFSPTPSGTTSPATFTATTDADGRVKAWTPRESSSALSSVLSGVSGASSRWTLRFDTAGYFGDEGTFFPEATVVFRVDAGQTYHVPLLLSPYSYTTYRGS